MAAADAGDPDATTTRGGNGTGRDALLVQSAWSGADPTDGAPRDRVNGRHAPSSRYCGMTSFGTPRPTMIRFMKSTSSFWNRDEPTRKPCATRMFETRFVAFGLRL